MDGCDDLIYHSELSVSEEGRQDSGAGGGREKAVVTNEVLPQ